MSLKTLIELNDFLIKKCYNTEYYSINKSPKSDGLCIEKWGELFVLSYFERGRSENIDYFEDEVKAVEFVYDLILKDKYANSHLIAALNIPAKKNELRNKLNYRNINYWMDEIPTLNGNTTRFFIIGCDIKKVVDLIDKELV